MKGDGKGKTVTRPLEKKTLLRVLSGESCTPPPFWLMRQAGRYLPEYRAIRQKASNFLDFCYSPDLACEAALQPIRRYGMDGSILFSDILTIPDALGQSVSFQKNEGPVLTPIRSEKDLDSLDSSDFDKRLAPVYETLRLLRKALPETTTLIGFSGSPWTLACYMVEGRGSKDFSVTRRHAYGDPVFFQKLIDQLVESIIAYLSAQIEAGAEAVQLFDSWAGVLAEKSFFQWVIEPTSKIVSALQERYPSVPVIGFPRGAGILYEAYVRQTGVSAVSLDTSVPLGWAADVLQPLCPVQGNLDPVLLVTGGDGLDEAVDRLFRTLGHGPFIFNLGHGIVPDTPPENVDRLVRRLRSFKI